MSDVFKVTLPGGLFTEARLQMPITREAYRSVRSKHIREATKLLIKAHEAEFGRLMGEVAKHTTWDMDMPPRVERLMR
jgi:hypothetical protein